MQLVKGKVSIADLKKMSEKMFNKIVKAVVDIELGIMAIDAEMHVDLESFLLDENESEQDNLWGINLHPNKKSDDEFVEFGSVINIRPMVGNNSRFIEDAQVRKKIILIVNKLVEK